MLFHAPSHASFTHSSASCRSFRMPSAIWKHSAPYFCDSALKRLRANSALKRGSRFEVSLSELEDCIPGSPLDEQLSAGELSAQINAFLAELSRDDRVMFVKRYWFAETITEIADGFGITESNASVRLSRIRGRLRKYLKSKEVYI